MYISKLRLHNFKGFKGDHEFTFDKGINFLVGENNCGKSTVFKAIDFIQNGKLEEDFITKSIDDSKKKADFVSVEIEFSGDDLPELVELEALKKYKDYISVDETGNGKLSIMRSSDENEIVQNGKQKKLSIKQVRVYNPKTNQFENPTGIDSTIAALFDAQYLWANTDSDDILDFNKTRICGRIIEKVVSEQIRDSCEKFKESHTETFNDIANTLEPIKKNLETKLAEQYGEAEVNFNFTLPQISDFLKSGNIDLTDNGIQTSSSEKGTGMQRSLALALIQVYAELTTANSASKSVSKPILFFIDEPETFLHPKAQNKLLDSLESLSNKSQIFISTHSPYLLRKYKRDSHQLWLFTKENGYNKESLGQELDLFGSSSPTWGEINYFAYGIPSVEFHNELYGFIQAKAILQNPANYKEASFDTFLVNNSNGALQQNKLYNRLEQNNSTTQHNRTISTYIRNVFHHPENTNNPPFTDTELQQSINALIETLKGIK